MRRLERFSGIEVLTYVEMGNHFHLLLRVPERTQILRKLKKGARAEGEARLLEHLKAFYSRAYLQQLKAELEITTELREGKKLSKAASLRCRVRYFTDGLVLGSREFVDKAFEEKRSWFGPKRKTGARGLPVEEKSLFSLRDLKMRALE